MIKVLKPFLFLMLFFLFQKINGQHPVYYHLTEKDGLPDIEIYQALEDQKGFIWLAANKGLYRYDGKEFVNYSNPKKRGRSVFNLQIDEKGRVWCNNISGQYFYVENETLTLFIDIEKEVNGQLYQFYIDKNQLLITTSYNLITIDIKSKKKTSIFKKTNGFRTLYRNENSIYSIENDQLNKQPFTKQNDIVRSFKKYKNKEFTNWKITYFKNQFIIHASNSENKKVKPYTFLISKDSLKEVKIFSKLKDNIINNFKIIDNKLWILTSNGLFVYENKNNSFKLTGTYLKNNTISDAIKDKFDNYWITTLDNGVFIIPNLSIEKYDTSFIPGNINTLENIDNTFMLFGTSKGIVGKLNNKDGNISILKDYENKKVSSIAQNRDYAFISIGKNSLTFDKSTQKLYNNDFVKNVKYLSAIGDTSLIFSSSAFSRIINLNSKKSKEIRNKRSYFNFYSKTKKEIFIAYVDGLKKYDKNLEESNVSFNEKPIFALYIDETSDGTIWTSTFKDGIIGIKNGGNLINYNTTNGLISKQTNIIKADENLLWISSDKGLQVLNTDNNSFKTLTKKDGITSSTIFDINIVDDYVIFSSNNGVFKLNKENAFKKQQLANFYFSSILIDDQKVSIKDDYTLASNSRKIQFNFKTNGFLAEENLQYKYQLINGNNDQKIWNIINKNTQEIAFNNLAPGNYVFNLKSSSVEDNQETPIKKVKILVKSPFYKTWWFLTLTIFSIIGLLFFAFSYRIHKLKTKQQRLLEKERMQKQLASSKLESLQAQMNPHFTFNALNSIQNLVLKGNREEAYSYLNKYASLIRTNLNQSQKNFINFDEELEMLKKYLAIEKLRFRDNFEYNIYVDESVNAIEIPTLIIQPFVENAIKHGLLHKINGKRLLEIHFKQKEVLECTIIDNGVGIDASKKINKKNQREVSFSTKSIKEKLSFLKDFYKMDIGFYYEQIKEGTKVIIKIPYKQ